MIIAHKIALDPNQSQQTYFARACGTARFASNWALAEWKRQYRAGEKPSEASLRRQLNSIKDEQFPWMREVTKNAPQQVIKNLGWRQPFQARILGSPSRNLDPDPHARIPHHGGIQ